MRIKLSKASWKSMGQKMGWLKTSQSTGSDNEQDRMELTETHSEFSYLTNGHEDDSRMTKLRQMAEAIAERYDGAEDVHVALYWLLSDYYNGQHSPEYAALSSRVFLYKPIAFRAKSFPNGYFRSTSFDGNSFSSFLVLGSLNPSP